MNDSSSSSWLFNEICKTIETMVYDDFKINSYYTFIEILQFTFSSSITDNGTTLMKLNARVI